MPTKPPPPKPGNPQSKARPLAPPGKAPPPPPPSRGALAKAAAARKEDLHLATQVLRPDEAAAPSRVDIHAHTGFDNVGFEDGAATQLSSPQQIEEIRRGLAAQARAKAGAKEESDATMLGGPSFVEEVRAQLAAAGVTAPDAHDEDSFAPESGIRDAVELPEEDPDAPGVRDDPLSDPVIAAILAADGPEPSRSAAPPRGKPSAVRAHAEDVWGPITTEADNPPPAPRGAPPAPSRKATSRPPPPPPPPNVATTMELAPDLDLPPAPPLEDDFDVDFLDDPEGAPAPKAPPPPPKASAPKTRLTPAAPAARPPPPPPPSAPAPSAAKTGSGPKARPSTGELAPDVLKPAPVSPPLRTHRVGSAAGKLLLAVPEGARVTVERQQAGVGNLLLVGMEPQARVAVEVAVDGYTPWRSMVSLGGKPTGQVKVELRKPGR